MGEEAINKGRQLELDFAKAFALISMVICHVYEEMSLPVSGIGQNIGEFFFALCAPIFMFCMGIGIIYSKRSNPKEMTLRGINLFIAAYLLNFFRGPLALIILKMLNQPIPAGLFEYLLFNIDILQFAGLAFLTIALMKKLKFKTWHMLVASLVLQIIGGYLGTLPINGAWQEFGFGLFRYTSPASCFPLFLWLFYPVLGMLFGEKLQCVSDKDKFYKKICLIGGICMLISFALMFFGKIDIKTVFELQDDNFYRQTFLHYAFTASEMFILISAFYALSKIITNKYIISFVKYIGTNLNLIFIIHWLLIENFAILVFYELEPKFIVPVALAFLIVSVIISKVYLKIKKR